MEATSNPGPGRSASGEGKTNRAQEKADELKRVTKEKTSGLKAEVRERAEDVKEEMRGRVEEKKHVATEKVHALAHALRAAGDTLEEEGESGLARYGRQAADQVERLASYIDGNDTSGMMRQFESMARDNPAAFTGTTFAAGLLLGRFLRASRPDDTWEDRARSFGRGDGMSDDARGFGSGTFTGGAGFGSPAETAFAGERMTDIGPTTGGIPTGGTRPSDLGDMPGSTQRAGFDEGNIGGTGYGEPGSTRTGTGADRSATSRESGTGFETPGTSFGSGAGHATTGSGSTAGRSGIDTDENRSEQDRQRSGDRSEGGSSNG